MFGGYKRSYGETDLAYCVTLGWIGTIWSGTSKGCFGQYESQQSGCLNCGVESLKCGGYFFSKVIYLYLVLVHCKSRFSPLLAVSRAD